MDGHFTGGNKVAAARFIRPFIRHCLCVLEPPCCVYWAQYIVLLVRCVFFLRYGNDLNGTPRNCTLYSLPHAEILLSKRSEILEILPGGHFVKALFVGGCNCS